MAAISSYAGPMLAYLRRCITIDARALAAFRVLTGLLILVDLVLRAQHFSRLYTNDGAVPQSVAMYHAPDNAFSLYYLSTSSTFVAALFVITGLVAVQLIVGYHTRIAMLLSFLLVVSLDHHNPLVLSHADTLFRLLTFWAIFLPLGARWSIDALQDSRPRPRQIASVASAAILLQMVYMYFRNGLHKVDSDTWRSGDATPLIFGLDDTTYLIGPALRAFPAVLEVAGYLWFFSLMISPLLLLLSGRWRLPIVALFLGGHLAFAFTVRIGAFPWVAIAGVLLFLQAEFWRDAASVLARLNLARAVNRTSAAIEDVARRAAHTLPAYDVAALVPPSLRQYSSDLAVSLAVLVVLLIPAIDALHEEGVIGSGTGALGNDTQRLAAVFGVHQSAWTVFAPNPRATDRYHVFAAQTEDGRLLDIYNDRPLTFVRPYRDLTRQYPSYRDRFYISTIRDDGFEGPSSRALAEYLCRQWTEERVTRIEMWVVEERVTRDTIDNPEGRATRRALIYRHGCDGREPVDLDLANFM